uniref:Putative conserved protein with signal anchor n=1 Tax=Amblyomma parvum TaxID=251391 RepID=A0A023G0X1_AMBPA
MWIIRKRLYRLVRRAFPSLEYADHETVRRRLSFVYAFAAWQGFVALMVLIYRKRAPTDDRGIDYAKFLAGAHKNAETATIISISGSNVSRQVLSGEELETIRQQREEVFQKRNSAETA